METHLHNQRSRHWTHMTAVDMFTLSPDPHNTAVGKNNNSWLFTTEGTKTFPSLILEKQDQGNNLETIHFCHVLVL